MTFTFKPAASFTERPGIFVAVTGGTNSGKSFSALRLARGMAGAKKVAAADTEGGRLLHLRKHFDFDMVSIDPPHRPERYAEVARIAEEKGYGALVIDSFSMEWVGLGGVLDWQEEEFKRLGSREAMKLMSWAKPKGAHKAMVYSLLQRRIPIVFAMRAEEKAKKVGSDVKAEWAPICNKAFPFEVTVSFMLMQNRQGIIDLNMPHKMEGSHREIFKDGEQLSERHGELLMQWANDVAAGRSTDAGGDPGGLTEQWPTFGNLREFATWSKDTFLPIATAEQAKAWEVQFRSYVGKLMNGNEAAQQAGSDLMALYAERIAPPPIDDGFGAEVEQPTTEPPQQAAA